MYLQVPVFYLLIAFCVIQCSAAKRPGLQLAVSQTGLDKAAQVAIDQLTHNVQGQHIPDFSGKSRLNVGKVDYTFKNIVIRSFSKPTSKITITPGLGLTWSTNGAALSIHGNWRVKYRYHFIRIRDSGSVDVSVSGVSFSQSVKMGVDKAGRPTIFSTACTSGIGSLKVKFHGGASWLYNLFKRNIAKAMKSALQKAMCSAAKKAIDTDAAKKLEELKVVTPLGKQMTLDYRLTQAPVFDKSFLQSMHKGEVTWTSDPKPFPAEPAPFPTLTSLPQMLYISASEYIINSYVYAAYTHGLIQYNLSASSMPKGQGGFLNTTCHKSGTSCIGVFLHQVAVKYPNSSMIIDMGTSQAPYIRVSPKSINLNFVGEMTFSLRTLKNKVVYLFKMLLTVDLSVRTWLDNHTVKADITAFKAKVKVVDSKVGNISDVNMQFIFNVAYHHFIEKQLKDLGLKGIEIPNLKNVKYVKPKLQLNQGSITFGTDIVWTPKHLFEHLEQKHEEAQRL